jgi:hypothetical protein
MTTTQAIVQPNLFELQGYNTEINYSTTSILGVPQLTYTYRGKARLQRVQKLKCKLICHYVWQA